MKRFLTYLGILFALIAALCTAIIAAVQFGNVSRIHATADAPHKPVAIVLGASVNRDGTASDALRDRVLTAADLYHASKTDALLMTGDDGEFHVNEIAAMVTVAREAGVPEQAIMTDGHGYRTYESCKRAAEVLGIKSALVVTQRFHLGRALYLCRNFGMDAEGVSADRQSYIRIVYFWIRDLAASFKAFLDVHILPPVSPVSAQELPKQSDPFIGSACAPGMECKK